MASFMQTVVLYFGVAVCLSEGLVTLTPLSTTYLPYRYKGAPAYKMFTGALEQIDYDPEHQLAYTIGASEILHVIDMSDPSEPRIIHHVRVPGVPNDLDVCGDHVAVAVRNKYTPLPGKAVLFSTYDRTTRRMRKVNEFQVGHAPASAIVFTKDCRTLLVANEGEPGKDEEGRFVDPEGSVTIIRFGSDDLTTNYTVHTADFRKFNDRADEYTQKGVRWVYHGERSGAKTQFSDDIEPEWITLSEDESHAYVSLQENNAFAVIDIEKAEVVDMYPLGVKNWAVSGLDASDKDGGINIRPWQIKGFYQPDCIKRFSHDGVGYIVSANEGDAKAYRREEHGLNWSEFARGRVFVEAGLIGEEVEQRTLESLQNDKELGRLKLSLVDGRPDEYSQYDTFYAYGGRGFSIWREDDLSLAWDSGAEFERAHETFLPDTFNNHVDNLKHQPADDKDLRSDDMGPEVEVVETATIEGTTYIFIGNQRASTLMVYSLVPGSMEPRFESILRPGGSSNITWGELYAQRNIGDGNVQDLKFIRPEDSGNGRPLLLVSGSISGTFSVYQVNLHADHSFTNKFASGHRGQLKNGTVMQLEVGKRHKETSTDVPPPPELQHPAYVMLSQHHR